MNGVIRTVLIAALGGAITLLVAGATIGHTLVTEDEVRTMIQENGSTFSEKLDGIEQLVRWLREDLVTLQSKVDTLLSR